MKRILSLLLVALILVPCFLTGCKENDPVPAATKAEAVYNTVKADITADVPATIMRLHDNATMYCDADSGAKLL